MEKMKIKRLPVHENYKVHADTKLLNQLLIKHNSIPNVTKKTPPKKTRHHHHHHQVRSCPFGFGSRTRLKFRCRLTRARRDCRVGTKKNVTLGLASAWRWLRVGLGRFGGLRFAWVPFWFDSTRLKGRGGNKKNVFGGGRRGTPSGWGTVRALWNRHVSVGRPFGPHAFPFGGLSE